MKKLRLRLGTRWGPLVFATSVAVLVASLLDCKTLKPLRRPLTASLRTDSAEIGVHFRPPVYVAKIGFVFVNTTPGPISKAGCGGPGDPQVEKQVNGDWVPAYHPVYLACRTTPDFRIASGAVHRGVISFAAYQRGHNTYPVLLVDSVDGIYRLRWSFMEGIDATIESARRVDAISNEFRMVLRDR